MKMFISKARKATVQARRMAGEITRQRLMPPAKQTTISCSVCSRLRAMMAATNRDTGRIRLNSWGRASRVM